MPKSKYYSDVKVIKKPIKKRLKSILNFLIFVCIFVGVIFASIAFSNALQVGDVGAYLVYGDTSISIKSSSIYILSMGEFESLGESEQVALGSSIQGASGYVWRENNMFYVVGSIYPSLDEANKVINNLKDTTKYNLDVIPVNFPDLKIKLSDYENKQVNKVEDAILFLDKLYSSIYGYSISFDKSEINNFAISSNLSDLRGECKVKISNMQDLLKTSNKAIKRIQSALILIDELLDESIIKTIDNSTTNYSLKNTLAKVVRIKYDLYNDLIAM